MKIINQFICGDALAELRKLPEESVDMCMTSPPYYGLRDYGNEQIFGGDKDCEHTWGINPTEHDALRYRGHNANVGSNKNPEIHQGKEKSGGQDCIYCGAWKGQLGLEPTPELYIEHLTEIFNEVKRVLKKEGTLWLNIGDTYGGSGGAGGDYNEGGLREGQPKFKQGETKLQPKCLCMIPERLAWSLIQNGWILRNKIIWYKPNAMPSSVKDRFSNRWEYIFLFSKAKERSKDIKFFLDKSLKPEDASWLAAMVDGEGTITIRRSKREGKADVFGASICVNNCFKPIIEKCQHLANLGTIKKGKGTNKPIYTWELTHQNAISIIAEIYPYLIAKKEQAKVVIALQKTNKYRGDNRWHKNLKTKEELSEQLRLHKLVKSLNQGQIEQSGLLEPNLNRYSGAEKYYFDLDAVREPHKGTGGGPGFGANVLQQNRNYEQIEHPSGKNPGDIFEINTQAFPEAHFAVFPEKLCLKPIKAGCPEEACKKCGKARERMVEKEVDPLWKPKYESRYKDSHGTEKGGNPRSRHRNTAIEQALHTSTKTIGWTSCNCDAGFEGGVVLDPFAGAGTVGVVAKSLGRRFILIDTKEEYVKMAKRRVAQVGHQKELYE